jgi:hypothetical protein
MSGAVIGSLRAELSANIAKFQSDMGQAADTIKKFSREAKKVGREIEDVGKSMSIALTLPLVALGREATKKAADAAQAFGLLQATIASAGNASGKTAEQLEETAKQLRNISTYDDEDILRGVTVNLLRFGNVQGPIFDRAQKSIVNLSSALGQDLQSASIKVGRALQDPIKGMQALTRLGITFTSAQKEQVKEWVRAGDGAKAQNMILLELEKRFDGAAKALRDATPGAELKNAWEDFGETIGAQIIPILKDLMGMLSSALKFFTSLPEPIQKLAVALAFVAAAIGPLLTGFGFFIKMGGQIATLLATLFTWLASLEVATLGWVAAIAAVGIALVIFWQSARDILHGDFKKAWTDAKDTAKSIAGEIKGIWDSVTTGAKPAQRKGAGVIPGAGTVPAQEFNRDDEAEIEKRKAALKELQTAIQATSDKIKIGLSETALPQATSKALALNLQIDAFVKKAADAGVNTAKFSGQIASLRTRIEELRQAGLEKEAIKFAESVDQAAVAADRLARGGLPPLQDKLANVEDSFASLRNRIQDEIAANEALADTNADAASAMERLKQILAGLVEAHDKVTKAAIAQAAAEQALRDLATERNNFETRTQIEDLNQAAGRGGPVSSQQADLQAAGRQLQATLLESSSKLKELEVERARLVEQNMNGENDRQIANLTSELELQQQLHDLVATTTADQLVAAKKIDEAFTSFADELSTQLADMLANWDGSLSSLSSTFRKLAEQIFIKPGTDSLTSSISGGLKDLFSTAQGAGGGGGGNPLSGFMDSFAGMFADGGSLNPGQWGIAGEHGPEPIFGGAHGLAVMSNDQASQGGGRGRTVNQTWNITTPDANSFRATQRQTIRQAKQALGMGGGS